LVWDQVSDSLTITNLRGTIIDCNPATERIQRRSRAEIVGRTVHDLGADPDELGNLAQRREQADANRAPGRTVRHIKQKDGSERTLSTNLVTLRDAKSRAVARLVIARDITEEEEVRRLHRLHSLVWNQSSDSLQIVSLDGRILDCNLASQRLAGLELPSLIGRETHELTFGLSPHLLAAKRREADSTGSASFETKMRRADGTMIDIAVTLNPLRDEAGQIVARLVTTRDLSAERRAAELDRLHRDSVQRYVSLVEASRDAIVSVDRRGAICLVNPAATAIFGYTREELLGEPLARLLPENVGAAHEHWLEDFFAAAVSSRPMARLATIQGRRKDGSSVDIQVNLSKSLQHGEEVATAIIRDVTDSEALRRQVQQAEKLSALGQLTGGIAHDFNNLLAIMISSAELLEDKLAESPEILRVVERITRTGKRGAELTKHLLAFSRTANHEPVEVDVRPVLEDLADTLSRTLASNITIRLEASTDAHLIRVDRSMLENCLINLCLNARDAMPGGGTLALGLMRETSPATLDQHAREQVVITVRDTGSGMTDEVRERIFEPFFTTKLAGKGTGLGLSMVYGFVQQSGGSIAVDTAPGRGTAFTLRFPAAFRTTSPGLENKHMTRPPAALTVLLVEDDDDVRDAVADQLSRAGCEVITAASAAEARRVMASRTDLDLVMTDYDLGSGDTGLELGAWIAQQAPRLPIVIISGYLDAPTEAIEKRGWRILYKPLSRLNLSALLDATPRR
jgi:PAS domain S-box-containing protein